MRTIFHYDVYRLADYDELADLGFEELPPDAVALVEWGHRFAPHLPPATIRIAFQVTGDTQREVTITGLAV